MVKTIVRRHKRRTNKGRTTIKSHSRKIKGGVISPGELNIFSSMQKYPKEFGGNIDLVEIVKLKNSKFIKVEKIMLMLIQIMKFYSILILGEK